jgi:Flp pilus assembly protein TadG
MRRKQIISGQGLVEFALLLPVFLLMIMIAVDLSRAAYYYSAVYNAAREGARYGVVHWNDASRVNDTINEARRLAAGLGDDLVVTPAFLDTDGDGSSDVVQVTVTYSFETATPILSMLLGSATQSLTLRSQATMQLER